MRAASPPAINAITFSLHSGKTSLVSCLQRVSSTIDNLPVAPHPQIKILPPVFKVSLTASAMTYNSSILVRRILTVSTSNSLMMAIALFRSVCATWERPTVLGLGCSVKRHPSLNLWEKERKSSAVYPSLAISNLYKCNDRSKVLRREQSTGLEVETVLAQDVAVLGQEIIDSSAASQQFLEDLFLVLIIDVPMIIDPMFVFEEQCGVEMDETLMFRLFLSLRLLFLSRLSFRNWLIFDLLPIYYKLFLFCLFLYLLFLFLLLLLLHVLWLFLLILWGRFRRYYFPSFHSQPHIIWTEGWCSFIQMKAHILSSKMAKVQSSFHFLGMESATMGKMCEDGQIVDFSLQFFLLKESIGKDVHMVQIIQKILAYLSEADHPEHTEVVPHRVFLGQKVWGVFECGLLMIGDNFRDVSYVELDKLRKSDALVSTTVLVRLFVETAFELNLHESLTNFVLSSVVSSDYRAVRVPQERIEKGVTVVSRERVETDIQRILFFLGKLPIRLHTYNYERINALTKIPKFPSPSFYLPMIILHE